MAFGGVDAARQRLTTTVEDDEESDEDPVAVHYLEEQPNQYVHWRRVGRNGKR